MTAVTAVLVTVLGLACAILGALFLNSLQNSGGHCALTVGSWPLWVIQPVRRAGIFPHSSFQTIQTSVLSEVTTRT
jgi:hypothetical protein